MPSRVLREGLLGSEHIAALSFGAEVLFYRLILVADDYGLYDGRPLVIRCHCMALRPEVSEAQIGGWLEELEANCLIVRYAHAGKPYIGLLRFRQRTRAAKSKFPLPNSEWLADDGQETVKRPARGRLDEGGDGDVFGSGGGGVIGADHLPQGVDAEPWADFVAHRASIRKPLTARAVKLIFATLADFSLKGLDPNDSLRASVANGWTGVFEPKPKKRDGPSGGGRMAGVSVLEEMKHGGLAARRNPDGVAEAVPAAPAQLTVGK